MPTLNWIDEEAIVKHYMEVPFRPLQPVPELSCENCGAGETANWAVASGNLIVQGDDLLALKALLPRYADQARHISSTRRTNTGNEGWVHNVNGPETRKCGCSNRR